MKQRDSLLDIIRVTACLMVVLMHSPLPSANANGPFLSALSYLTAPCIGLFFMVSGALLMPVKDDCFTFLRRRLSKIIVPTMAWTAIYLALKIYYSESEINIIQSALSIPFSPQGHGVLWFMYTLTGLYLLAPILSAWVEKAKDREVEFVLILWGITLLFPLVENYLTIVSGTTSILYYFTGYAGYFLLGYYFKHRSVHLPVAIPIAVGTIGLMLVPILKCLGVGYDFYRLFWYESIFIAAMCCAIWMFINRVFRNHICWSIMGRLSNLTFGVYLCHILIMRYWIWKMAWIHSIPNYALQTLIIFILTSCLSFLLVEMLSRIPLIHNLIGYKTAWKK